MEQGTKEQSASQDETKRDTAVVTPTQGGVVQIPSAIEAPCPTCAGVGGSMSVSFVYALGRVEARFPTLAAEKEFAQAAGRADTSGQTDREVFQAVLS